MHARPADADVRAAFDVAAAALGSVLDVEQEPIVDRLTQLGDRLAGRRPGRWRRPRPPQGVYLHGPVGRGKTWLVDVLLQQLPVDGVLRLHAYDAARQLHAQVARQAGSSGASERAVNAALAGVRLLFLDELHAHDPGDAMLLRPHHDRPRRQRQRQQGAQGVPGQRDPQQRPTLRLNRAEHRLRHRAARRSTPTAPSARPAAPRPATPNVLTPSGLTAAQQQLARVRRRFDAIANRQQLRLTALRALQDNVRTATALVAQATPALPAPPALPQLPDLSTGTIRITDTGAGMSYEQLLLRVFSEHMRLGEAATRPAVEADADAIADTVAELLAALPEFDGPWGPAIGPVYRTEQVRALLGGVSRQALSDRVKRSTLLALKTRDGVTVYPAWQFSEGQVLSGLPEVLKLFAADEHGEIVDAWTLASWLRASLDELGGDSVSGRLRAGEEEAAVATARSAAARWSR